MVTKTQETEAISLPQDSFPAPAITSDWSTLRAEILTMTAAMCVEALHCGNTANRDYKKTLGDRMQRDMKNGNFLLTGKSIIFSYDPITAEHTLEDGHNRCANAIATNTSFRTVVVFGISPEAASRLDSGANRSRPDVIKMNKIPNHKIVSTALPFVTEYSNYRASELDNHSFLQITTDSALAHPLQEGAEVALKIVGMPQWLTAALYAVGSAVNRPKTQEFFSGLGWGNLLPGDPRVAFRNYVSTALLSPVGKRPGKRNFFVAGIRALRAFFEEQSLDAIKLRRSDGQKKNRPARLSETEEQADIVRAKRLVDERRQRHKLANQARFAKKRIEKARAALASS